MRPQTNISTVYPLRRFGFDRKKRNSIVLIITHTLAYNIYGLYTLLGGRHQNAAFRLVVVLEKLKWIYQKQKKGLDERRREANAPIVPYLSPQIRHWPFLSVVVAAVASAFVVVGAGIRFLHGTLTMAPLPHVHLGACILFSF